jgi:arylsulfatase A-like enzyme
VLSTVTPSEYQALAYAWVLYGVIGVSVGFAVGTAAAAAPSGWADEARAWRAAFFPVIFALGVVISKYVVNKAVYAEQGVPAPALAGLVGGFAVVCLVGWWLVGNLLTKTPLRAVPTPRGTVLTWGLGLAVCAMLAVAPAPAATGSMTPERAQGPEFAQKPDVILIMVDTLRADATSVYGAPDETTPNLAKFAADAVVFDQFVTSASWTRASTASLLSGVMPATHTCETKDSALPESVETLAEVMSRGGYVTGGVPNNANVTAAQGFGQGFDWFPYEPEYPLMASESTYALSMYSVVRKLWTKVDKKKRVEAYYQPAEKQFTRARAFLDANQDRRAFLFVHLMEPHDPYFTHPWTGEAYGRAEHPNPEPALESKLRALYAGEVHHADEQIGAFLEGLKAAGRYDGAVIMITADHGEEFLEHGGWWHGTTLYDEQIHVPLLLKLPGNTRAGVRVPWQVRQVDIAATIADLAGIAPSGEWAGRDLFDRMDEHLALLQPPPPPEPDPAAPPAAAPRAAPAFTAPDWTRHPASADALSQQDFEGYRLQSVRSGGRKVITAERVPVGNPRKQPPVQCFDLRADPGEKADQAAGGSGECAALQARLDALSKEAATGQHEAATVDASDAERARLEALGYMQDDVATEPAAPTRP